MPDMIYERDYHSSITMSDGKWWISGSANGKGKQTSEYFDVIKGKFVKYVDLPQRMHDHKMFYINETFILFVTEDQNIYSFNTKNDVFTQLPDMGRAREGLQAGLFLHASCFHVFFI